MGSTDGHGNRLSNMPGEERPSLTSVTPYDDNPNQMIETGIGGYIIQHGIFMCLAVLIVLVELKNI